MNAALLSPCRRTRRGTVRPARHLSTRCPRHQHTRVRQTRRSRSLLSGHSPAGVRRLPLRRKAAPQRQCSSSSRARASIATITSCRAPASRANQESRSSRSRCDATTARTGRAAPLPPRSALSCGNRPRRRGCSPRGSGSRQRWPRGRPSTAGLHQFRPPRRRAAGGRLCPTAAARPPAPRLLLWCLQHPRTWLAQGRVELGGRAVGVALRAIRPLRDSHHQVTHAHAVTDAGLGVRLVTRCCSAP